jgi:hypothetical protein
MQASENKVARGAPEQLIQGLVRKLSYQVLLDALLIFLPPLAAIFYFLVQFYRHGWLLPWSAALWAAVTLGVSAVALVVRYRPKIPSARSAARLIDDRAGAQDRFLTLATLPPSPATAFLLARLRLEAAGLQSRIALDREFPYTVKRPVYLSLVASLLAVVLFHLLLPVAHSTLHPLPVHERLRDLAQQMAARPNLQEIARSLKDFAAKLEDPKVLPQEKRERAREERRSVEQQTKQETQQQDRELLSQAAGALDDVEQQAGAGERKKEQEGGGGGIQSNLPEQGQGEGKQSQGSGGDNQGGTDAQPGGDTKEGKVAQSAPKEQSKSAAGDTNGGKTERAQSDESNQSKNDRPGTKDGPGADADGRNKVTEEVPQGAPPVDRLHKPGEGGYQGIKNPGYVTVQLPEDLAADGKGSPSQSSKGAKPATSQLPISNVPLPKHMPDAPTEKQQMPLEYRGIIR